MTGDGGLSAAAGTRIGRGTFRSCGSDLLSQRGERRQRRARGTSSEHTSLAPFPQNRNTAKTPYRSVAPPLQIETYRFDLRRTFRRNLQAATKGSCAVFRRIRTRNPSPSARGLRPPLDSLGFTRDERRGTKDERRGTKDERRGFGRELRIASPVCPLDQNDGQRLHFAAGSLVNIRKRP